MKKIYFIASIGFLLPNLAFGQVNSGLYNTGSDSYYGRSQPTYGMPQHMYVATPPAPIPTPNTNNYNPGAYRENYTNSIPTQRACYYTGTALICN